MTVNDAAMNIGVLMFFHVSVLGAVGGNADWCSHRGKQYGDTPKVKNGTAF